MGWQKLLVLRWLLMVLPFALWGTAMAAMKPLLTGATPLTIAWMRLLPAGLLLLVVAVLSGRSLAVAAADRPWLLLFALLCGLALLGESLKPVQWLGAALALVSVALSNRRRQLWEPQP